MKYIRRMTGRLTLLLLALLVVGLAGCKEEPGRTSLHLTMQEKQGQDRSIVPQDTPLEVSRYAVTGEGPQGSTFEIQSTSANMEIDGLLMGNWTITAVGQNKDGVNLVQGSTACTLTTEPTNAVIELKSLMGSGTMTVHFTWDQSKISSPSIELWVTDSEGIKSKVTPTTNNLINGSVSYSSIYPAGSYMVQARLYSGSTAVAGCAEVVRVVGSKTTEGTIALDLDKYPEIPSNLTLINKAGTPIQCSISGLSSTVEALQPVHATVTVPASEESSTMEVLWFLDGEEISSSLDCTFTPATGNHRLDLIAKGALLASSGSASISFKATVTGTAGIPVLVKVVSDNTNGLKISGNTRVAFLPDGKVLLASSIHQTLQICRIVRDSLEVIRTYTQADGFNTAQVTDILVDKTTNRVAVADNQHPGITLYQYNAGNASLTKLFSRDNVSMQFEDGYKVTFNSINRLILDPVSGVLYNTEPGSCKLPWTNFYATSQADFKINRYSDFLFMQEEMTGMTVSPDFKRSALFSTPANMLKMCERTTGGDILGYAQDYRTQDGIPYISAISAVEFLNNENVLTGNNNALNRFHLMKEPHPDIEDWWSQDETWLSGDNGLGEMLGIEQLLVNASRDMLYVVCSGSKNIKAFSYNEAIGFLNYEGSTSLDTFVPSQAAISPDKENMLVVSRISNQILILTIPH